MKTSMHLTGFAQQNDTVTLLSMLGKNIRGEGIQKWLSEVANSPEIDKFDDCFFYSYKQRGISLRFDTTETLAAIILYSEGADGFRQYQGKLPLKLSFMLNRNEIESILGKPDQYNGAGVINFWAFYQLKGIGITYNSKQTDNLNARIYTMSITKSR